MNSLPEVTLVGTLTAAPELRFTPSGAAVANFTVACNARKKTDNGWEDGDATFVRCNVWKEYAENVAESLDKGMKVIVRGSLKQRSWEQDNQKRTTMELEVEEVGPTLRFHTAKVSKSGQRAAASPANDAWGAWGNEPAF